MDRSTGSFQRLRSGEQQQDLDNNERKRGNNDHSAPSSSTSATIAESAMSPNPFHLPEELLEHILLYLTPKDLLLSQRTCRSFRHTILGSPRIQKALFFAPDWKSAHTNSNSNRNGNGTGTRTLFKPENNRLLLRAFPGCYPTVTLVVADSSRAANHSASHSQAHPSSSFPTDAPAQHHSWDICISFPASTPPPTTHPSVLDPSASWRRMFLSQPPCTSLHLVRRWQRSCRPAIVAAEGIRMGEFVEQAGSAGSRYDRAGESWSAGWNQSFVSSDRDWHFEGNISVWDGAEMDPGEGTEVLVKTRPAAQRQEYLFSRLSRNGVVRADSDDWDPGLASEFVRLAHL